MGKAKIFLTIIPMGLFVFGSLVFAQDFDMEKASQLFETKCSKCHSVERPKGKVKSREEWTATVKRMQGKSPGWYSDEEAETLIEYLSTTYGK